MTALYNDFDAKAAAWLRELIADGHLPAGEVSTASIKELTPDDCADTSHFFAGIGGWPLALDLAGWPAGRAVWTGSCPCQPFSAAGKRAGTDDPRHLWPDFLRLIAQRRPPVIFGEQVASADGRAWLAGVRADLEALGYAVGAADLCSAGVSAPHIRQRLYWGAKRLGNASGVGLATRRKGGCGEVGPRQPSRFTHPSVSTSGMADADSRQRDGLAGSQRRICDGEATGRQQGDRESQCGGQVGRVADASGAGLEGWSGMPECVGQRAFGAGGMGGENGGICDPRRSWRLAYCRDDRWRRVPVEPALFPLADGLPGRVGLLRGAGNAIDPWVAAEFVAAFMEARI